MIKFITLTSDDVFDSSLYIKFSTHATNSDEANQRFLQWLKNSYSFSGKVVYRQKLGDGVYIYYVRASNCERLD